MHMQLRWRSGRVCRYGTNCTFAHGEEELRSWMEYQEEIQETKSVEEPSRQKPETRADISKSQIQVPYQVSSRYSVRA